MIEIWTDGSTSNNRTNSPDSVGGWGVLLKYGKDEKELYGKAFATTNNRMEMQAVIEALKALKVTSIPITIYSDSQYVVEGSTNWMYSWRKLDWKSKYGGKVLNVDLWKEIYDLVLKFDSVTFVKIKGHAGIVENERVDKLAKLGTEEAKRCIVKEVDVNDLSNSNG